MVLKAGISVSMRRALRLRLLLQHRFQTQTQPPIPSLSPTSLGPCSIQVPREGLLWWC
jgi:hypothetical protein